MRRRLATLFVVVSAFAANGCAQGQGGNEFTYWSMWKPGEDQQKVLQAAFDEFTKDTGIKVKVQWAGRQVLGQVVPRLNAGDPPDLIDQGGTDIQAALAPVNGLTGLADVYQTTVDGETGKVADVVPANLVAPYRTGDGQPFLVPYEIIGSTMWYNAKLDPQLAAAQPGTWENFVATLDAWKAQGRTPIALDGDIKDYEAYWLYWALWRTGGPGFLRGSALDRTGATFDDPAWLTAASAVERVIKGGYFPTDFAGTKFPAQQSAWADQSSRTNVLLMGSWAPSETSASLAKSGRDLAKVEFRSFPFPALGTAGKGDGVVEAVPIGFAIPAKARNAAAAKRFLPYFLKKERLAKIATDARNLVPRTDITAPRELADFATEYRTAKTYVQSGDGTPVAAPKWVTNVWQPLVSDFFLGKYDAKGFVTALKENTVAFHQSDG